MRKSPLFRNKIPPKIAIGGGAVLLVLLATLIFRQNGESVFVTETAPPVNVTTGTVMPDQNLAYVLKSNNVDNPTAWKIQKSISDVLDLSREIRVGHSYAITTSTNGEFLNFLYTLSPIQSYRVTQSSDGIFSLASEEKKTVWIERNIKGTVQENMYKSLLDQGYSENFVANLVADLGDNIFAWRIDFFTEQRPGDEFNVLLEQEYIEESGLPLNNIRILASAYFGDGTRNRENYAIRYQSKDDDRADYFDLDGKAIRKAFLRTPFTHGNFRISSRFNPKRFHPIKRTYRPHHGIDYAAVTGTPVVSIGNGTVVRAGWHGGYGKCVDIRHNNKFTSRYGHLSSIGVKTGQKVDQGQYIGKVGKTGLATGPHLHFEMIVDGRKRNFLRLDFPSAKSVVASNMKEFESIRDQYMSRLLPGSPSSAIQLSQRPADE